MYSEIIVKVDNLLEERNKILKLNQIDQKHLEVITDQLIQEEKDAVKKSVLSILKEYYDMEEEDFLSAELEIVPAGRAKECGLDRSMVLGYGQDDRVCAFPSYKAMLSVKKVKKTAVCILTDKEEIGSVGATGM